ncbi:MAG: hypothetical protein HKP09_02460, partial [Enterobacterales bacterium]|nr:hypothetical protein [Enterobacterales bacterium]
MVIKEGQITIDCSLSNNKISEVSLTSSRPLEITQKLLGSSTESFLETIPRVFSVCGIAQVVAAQRALTNQTESPLIPKLISGQDLLIKLETIREQVFRIGTQWPGLFDLPIPKLDFKRLNDNFTRIKAQLFSTGGEWHWHELNDVNNSDIHSDISEIVDLIEAQLFNGNIASWMDMVTLTDLDSWCKSNHCAISSVVTQIMYSDHVFIDVNMPSLEKVAPSNIELAAKFEGPASVGFVHAPQWHDQCCETGPAARLINPLLSELSVRA